MPMRSRLPVFVALALALWALPSLHAFAAATCTPCCAQMSGAADPGCGLNASDCCELLPAAPVAPVEPVNPQLASPALAAAPIAFLSAPASIPVRPHDRVLAPPASPARLSVVRLL
jgi:hypothetical protein